MGWFEMLPVAVLFLVDGLMAMSSPLLRTNLMQDWAGEDPQFDRERLSH
jgi:hypothetical protein